MTVNNKDRLRIRKTTQKNLEQYYYCLLSS